MLQDDCIFCNIIKGKIPCSKIFEDENVLAFLDINPLAKGHTLVVPKYHFQTLIDFPEEKIEIFFKNLKKIATKISEKLEADGFNIIQNNFKAAGQEIDHFHVHIIPRWKNDCLFKGITKTQRKATQEELKNIQEILQN
ncbi:MAG: HIT family protein [Promethearchaeota archaeon]